jgi:uncharacterized protein
MQLHAGQNPANYIQSVTIDAVTIAGQRYLTPVLVSPVTIRAWQPAPLAALGLTDFEAALALEPEVILFGTGQRHQFVSNHLATAIMRRGVGFEVMGTTAACRTYNVLAAEDRRVVAALLLA